MSKPLHEDVVKVSLNNTPMPVLRPGDEPLHEAVTQVTTSSTPVPVMRPLGLPDNIPEVSKAPGSKLPVQERADVVRMGHLSCVPFARMWSGIKLRGNAHSWWVHAEGQYTRAHKPEAGAVLVFAQTRHLRYGHVAVVRRVINSREIRIDHANWGNRGRIYLNARVVDVSANNDWSEVKVWNTPLNTMGSRSYKVSGFILPNEPLDKTS